MAWPRSIDGLWGPALAALAGGAAVLALYWAFLVPIDGSPDEPQHLDYALSIYGAGGLLRAADRPTLPNGPAEVAHPYSRYLLEATDANRIRFYKQERVPVGYGTPAYYQGIDAGAPTTGVHSPPAENPGLLTLYPFGYYAALALWLGLISHLLHGLVALFFGARIFSIALLVGTLLLSYGIARELGCGRGQSLLLVGLIGFFPMTSFVASSIQADNLGAALVSACIYLGLLARRHQQPAPLLALLGVNAGLLLVTKFQFYLCTLVPVLAMLMVQRLGWPSSARRWGHALVLVMPASGLLALVHLWVVWGSTVPIYRDASGLPNTAAAHQALAAGPAATVGYIGVELVKVLKQYFVGGQTFSSFWGTFGWLDTPLRFGAPVIDALVGSLVLVGTLLTALLILIRLRLVGRRLLALARRRGARQAWRLALADPFFNSYLLFTVFMVAIYVVMDGTFYPPGRNWIPFLLPIWMGAIRYAPRLFRSPRLRRALATVVASALVVYCSVGSYFALSTVAHRFYGAPTAAQTPLRALFQWGGSFLLIEAHQRGVSDQPLHR